MTKTKCLTEDLPVPHGHVDDDLLGDDVLLQVLLRVPAEWRDDWKLSVLPSQLDLGPSLLHLNMRIRNGK